MPRCQAIFYQEEDDTVPALEWLRAMGRRDLRVVQKLQARIERLEEIGHALRRLERKRRCERDPAKHRH
jgi:hypothetical protein